MKKVLITGITGFVGSHLAEFILNEHPDYEVHGIKRWRSRMENIEEVEEVVFLHEADITDAESIDSTISKVRPDVIFHLAAQSYVPASFVSPVATMQVNAIGTINLLEAVRKAEIDPVIHICSSSEVYGQVSKEETPIKETNPLRPSSPYAVSKMAEDRLGYQYHLSYQLRTFITRAFTHTGPRRGEVFATSAFARQIAAIELGIQEPRIQVGNLDSVRTFLDVRDIVRAYWLLSEKATWGEVYNIGGKATMTIREMLDKLLSFSHISPEIVVDKSLLRLSDVTLQIPDTSKIEALGWGPTISFDKTLEDILDYWRNRLTVTQQKKSL